VERLLVPGKGGDHPTRWRRRVALVDVFRARDALADLSEDLDVSALIDPGRPLTEVAEEPGFELVEREERDEAVVIDRPPNRLLDVVDALLGGPIGGIFTVRRLGSPVNGSENESAVWPPW
jgi:hypothetical protein